jgi:hypothetical protein
MRQGIGYIKSGVAFAIGVFWTENVDVKKRTM